MKTNIISAVYLFVQFYSAVFNSFAATLLDR
jgi:hypothetical protein